MDNAHAGGMFCAVNANGSMGEYAVTEFNERFLAHPDSRICFSNHRIYNVDKVIDSAIRLHECIPQLGVINWDLTIDQDGEPVLIEANCKYGAVWVSQMAHGIGAFGDRIAEVLQWLRFMKSIKPCYQVNFIGGLIG